MYNGELVRIPPPALRSTLRTTHFPSFMGDEKGWIFREHYRTNRKKTTQLLVGSSNARSRSVTTKPRRRKS